MVDFAPALYHHIRSDSAACKTLYAPGWHGDSKFALTLPDHPARSMQDKFDFFFEKPLGVTMVLEGSPEAMESAMAGRHLIDWNCHSQGREWANQPAEYFMEFRQYAWSLPSPAPIKRDIIAVERTSLANYAGPATGAGRRKLDDVFYDLLIEDS